MVSDLTPETKELAKQSTEGDPDPHWSDKVDLQEENKDETKQKSLSQVLQKHKT